MSIANQVLDQDIQFESPATDDPEPPSSEATDEAIGAYRAELKAYSAEMFTIFKGSMAQEETMWHDFTTNFRVAAIPYLSNLAIVSWRDLLLSRYVYVRTWRGYTRRHAILDVLQAENFPRDRRFDGARQEYQDDAADKVALDDEAEQESRDDRRRYQRNEDQNSRRTSTRIHESSSVADFKSQNLQQLSKL
jgi:hypothetical protein